MPDFETASLLFSAWFVVLHVLARRADQACRESGISRQHEARAAIRPFAERELSCMVLVAAPAWLLVYAAGLAFFISAEEPAIGLRRGAALCFLVVGALCIARDALFD